MEKTTKNRDINVMASRYLLYDEGILIISQCDIIYIATRYKLNRNENIISS